MNVSQDRIPRFRRCVNRCVDIDFQTILRTSSSKISRIDFRFGGDDGYNTCVSLGVLCADDSDVITDRFVLAQRREDIEKHPCTQKLEQPAIAQRERDCGIVDCRWAEGRMGHQGSHYSPD